MNLKIPSKEATSWMVYSPSISHSLPIAAAISSLQPTKGMVSTMVSFRGAKWSKRATRGKGQAIQAP